MKFELNPNNRGVPDEVLLDDLRSVARALSADSVSRDQYGLDGRFHPKTLVKRFGSWNRTLALAGLRVQKPHKVTSAEFIADLKEVAESEGRRSLTLAEYTKRGRFSPSPIASLFGSWAQALSAAGLEVSPDYHAPLSDEELHQNLEAVWRAIGRQPMQKDLRTPPSRVKHDAYVRRFGSWRRALEAFVTFVNESKDFGNQAEKRNATPATKRLQPIANTVPKTSRAVSWRLRFLVMRRDKFRCCQCGASPAQTHGTVLVIDHVNPWSKGGETVMENLQTLCLTCNGGKSDLAADGETHAA